MLEPLTYENPTGGILALQRISKTKITLLDVWIHE